MPAKNKPAPLVPLAPTAKSPGGFDPRKTLPEGVSPLPRSTRNVVRARAAAVAAASGASVDTSDLPPPEEANVLAKKFHLGEGDFDGTEIAKRYRLTPLDYLLTVMNDDTLNRGVRIDAAKAAAPYVHSRALPRQGATPGLPLGVMFVPLAADPSEWEAHAAAQQASLQQASQS